MLIILFLATTTADERRDQPRLPEPLQPNCTNVQPSQPVVNEDLRICTGSAQRQKPQEQPLSAEAAKILEELPILSFMRSKVLMFPIKDDL